MGRLRVHKCPRAIHRVLTNRKPALALRDQLPPDDDTRSTACLRRGVPIGFPCAEGRLHNLAAAPRRTFRTIAATSCGITAACSAIAGIHADR